MSIRKRNKLLLVYKSPIFRFCLFPKKQFVAKFYPFKKYQIKFIYSEKATKFCEIFHVLLTTVHTVKSKGKISQNFVAFSEYMNFNTEFSCFRGK